MDAADAPLAYTKTANFSYGIAADEIQMCAFKSVVVVLRLICTASAGAMGGSRVST